MPISGDFLSSAMAGIAFIGCALSATPAPGSPPQAQGRRREVVVNGKRVKTIDVHAHCIVPAAAALVNHPLSRRHVQHSPAQRLVEPTAL